MANLVSNSHLLPLLSHAKMEEAIGLFQLLHFEEEKRKRRKREKIKKNLKKIYLVIFLIFLMHLILIKMHISLLFG